MSKRIIITEEQLNKILTEELGIAKEVSKASKELKKELFLNIEKNDKGAFDFIDFKVLYNVFRFKTEEEFYYWYDKNFNKLVNGYSKNDNLLRLSIIVINNNFNVSSLNDIIQHELEHYYQSKMAGYSFGGSSYNNAYHKMNDYNSYIKYISRIEYFSKHFEIDAFVNGAYFASEDLNITSYDSFIEQTDLKNIKKSLIEAFNFFKDIKFEGMFFNEMLVFIKKNGYYKNCEDYNKLRKKICEKCKKAYNYFLRKSTRAYALIKSERDNNIKNETDIFIKKVLNK